MAKRPGTLCVLQKGKLIDSQNGFVDTFNWLTSWISNFKADKETGLKLDVSKSDSPTLKTDKNAKSEEIEVVTSISYDTTTHALTYTTKKVKASVVDGSEKTYTAFTAVEAYE